MKIEIRQYRDILKQIPDNGGIVSFLTNGYWDHYNSPHPRFSLSEDRTITVNISTLSPDWQQLARWALESWSQIANINFMETDSQDAQILFNGSHGEVQTEFTIYSDGSLIQAVVVYPEHWASEDGNTIDSYAFNTFVHEIGHALGLGHPGTYNGEFISFEDAGMFNVDVWNLTILSYFEQNQNPNVSELFDWATPVTPGLIDVIAIQNMYGETDVNAGNSIYGLNSNTGTYLDELFNIITKNTIFLEETAPAIALTIVDTGGIDTLDFRNDVDDQSFALNLYKAFIPLTLQTRWSILFFNALLSTLHIPVYPVSPCRRINCWDVWYRRDD